MSASSRSFSIDALRGAAIVMMIFSGVIPYGGALPGWMYHAQVPPPEHLFKPEVAGITWVDLVFPFFLFAMGAAVPFALPGRMQREGAWPTLLHMGKRFLLLLLFAVLSFNLAPLRIPHTGQWANYIGLLGYLGLFLAFVSYPGLTSRTKTGFRVAGWGLLAALAAWLLFGFKKFDPGFNDSIIRVLANVYLVGGAIWMLTRRNPLLRTGIALTVMAFYLGDLDPHSWVSAIWRLHDPWNLVSPFLLKYLLIFLPGTLVGDWIGQASETPEQKPKGLYAITGLAATLIALWSLYAREVSAGFLLTLGITAASLVLLLRRDKPLDRCGRIFLFGALCLTAGYLIEPFQGGIKKDHATLSYFILTSGLAALWVCAFEEMGKNALKKIWTPVALVGQNALMAYLIAGFLIVPLFAITALDALFSGSTALQVVRAVCITLLSAGISGFLANMKVFWKL